MPIYNNFNIGINNDMDLCQSYIGARPRDKGGLDLINSLLYSNVNSSNYGQKNKFNNTKQS